MAATLVVNNNPFGTGADETQLSRIYSGLLNIAAGSYVANGLPINWAAMKNGAVNGAPVLVASLSVPPYKAIFTSKSGTGYTYQWDAAHGTVRIFLGGVELTVAAIPAAVVADLVQFEAWWVKA